MQCRTAMPAQSQTEPGCGGQASAARNVRPVFAIGFGNAGRVLGPDSTLSAVAPRLITISLLSAPATASAPSGCGQRNRFRI